MLFLFCKLSVHLLCLFSYWVAGLCLLFVTVIFVLRKLSLGDTSCRFPRRLLFLIFWSKGLGLLKVPPSCPSPCAPRLWALEGRVCARVSPVAQSPHSAQSSLQGLPVERNWTPVLPTPARPPLWLGSPVSTSSRKRWLFSLLTTAMHLFGLNWHLQPMEGQMYEITEDTASSWPVPTDVSLYPSGGTGLEIPDRKGKGATEGRVAVLFVSWVLCVCLWAEETAILRATCLTHSSMPRCFLHPPHATPLLGHPCLHRSSLSLWAHRGAGAGLMVLRGIPPHTLRAASWAFTLLGGRRWWCGIMIRLPSGAASWHEWASLGVGYGKVGRGCGVQEIPLDLWFKGNTCPTVLAFSYRVALSKSLNFPELISSSTVAVIVSVCTVCLFKAFCEAHFMFNPHRDPVK